MNRPMAYLLGMIIGNGEIQRGKVDTTVVIEIPHKKLKTEFNTDVAIYVKASMTDIKSILDPLLGTSIEFRQVKNVSYLSFTKPNKEYVIQEIMQFVGNATKHTNMRIPKSIEAFTKDEKYEFIRGFADVTGYIRRSNRYFGKTAHRVYFEIPQNWELVGDFCNLLKSVDIPVQNIDWGHPNIRDGALTMHKKGRTDFWKKEHQVKVWAVEFLPIGFGIIHKQKALERFAKEQSDTFSIADGKKDQLARLHRYYWELRKVKRVRLSHPGENDGSLPSKIRGKHFDSWQEIANIFDYNKESK